MGGRKMITEAQKRKLARLARKLGKAPSEAQATTGATRQRRHVDNDAPHEERTGAHANQPWTSRPRQSRRVK
jgi:hypothetical protein